MTGVFLIIILAVVWYVAGIFHSCLLYTSDAADD